MEVNVDKSKVLVLEREGSTVCVIQISEEILELVNKFKYLGCVIDKRGECRKELENRVTQRRKVAGAIKMLVKGRNLSIKAARRLHEGILGPILMY